MFWFTKCIQRIASISCSDLGAASIIPPFTLPPGKLAEIASKAKPKLLVLYHQLYFGPHDQVDLEKEIHRTYTGLVVNGQDLTAY